MISGLYKNQHGGTLKPSTKTLTEVTESLRINPHYREQLICYADSKEMADFLEKKGCFVHKVFDDAPSDIIYDTKHKMKHWMMFNAVKEFKNVLWIDWDTYNIKPIDEYFLNYCYSTTNPKYTWINNYWAIVNCAVYYLNEKSLDIMEKSFSVKVESSNDELLWAAVLPPDVRNRSEYWLNDFVINIWQNKDFDNVTENTYFLHLKDFSMLNGRYL